MTETWNVVQPLWKTAWQFLQKLKIELPYDPAIAMLDVHPKERKAGWWKDGLYNHILGTFLTKPKRRKQPTPPSANKWVNKCGISIHMQEYYSTIRSVDTLVCSMMLPCWLSGKESACQCKRQEFDPWVRKIPCRRKWQATPVFLPGEFHGHRSLAGYSPWGHKESDMT